MCQPAERWADIADGAVFSERDEAIGAQREDGMECVAVFLDFDQCHAVIVHIANDACHANRRACVVTEDLGA